MKTFRELRILNENEEPKMTPAQEKKREEIVLSLKKKKEEFIERYGSKWEKVMYATATKLAMEEQVITEEEEWGLIFEFDYPEYTSKEGREIQRDLERKFKKVYSGSGSGGSGWDVSFNGSKKELEKAKKYVESKYKKFIDPKYTVLAVMDESVELEEMSAKAHYKKYQAKFVVPPIDKDRHPNREKEGLEGPYRSKKSGKIFYYDKKEGKYYDPESDMYLDVKDVMESTPAYRKMMKDYAKSDDKKVFDILKDKGWKVHPQDDTLVRNMLKRNKGNVKKTAAEIEKKYSNRFESVELDESQRFGGDTNIPASPEITKYIESGKGIILDVPSSLHPTSRFAIYNNPAKGSRQDKVLMATISNPKRGRVKMFSFHGTHVSHQKAMDFAKKHKLVAMKDEKGNPLYAKESVMNEGRYDKPVKFVYRAKNVKAMRELSDIAADEMPNKVKQGFFSVEGNPKSKTLAVTFNSEYDREQFEDEYSDELKRLTVRESVNEVWQTPEERHQVYHDMALDLITQIQGVDAVRKAVNDGKWIDSFGDKVGPKINLDLDTDKPGTVEYQQNRGRGDWTFTMDVYKGNVTYTHKGKSGKFKDTVDFGKYIRSTNESVELDEGWKVGDKVKIKPRSDAERLLVRTKTGKSYLDGVGVIQKVSSGVVKIKFKAGTISVEHKDIVKESVELDEGKAWDAILRIKDEQQAEKVHGMLVDMQTAKLLCDVMYALNKSNQKKFMATIDKNAMGLKKMVDFAWKQVK